MPYESYPHLFLSVTYSTLRYLFHASFEVGKPYPRLASSDLAKNYLVSSIDLFRPQIEYFLFLRYQSSPSLDYVDHFLYCYQDLSCDDRSHKKFQEFSSSILVWLGGADGLKRDTKDLWEPDTLCSC